MLLRSLAAYAAAALTLCLLDGLWLGVLAKDWYRSQLGGLMLDTPRWGAAVVFYAVYLVGVVLFGVWPGLRAGSWLQAALWGGLFGFFAYMTYDLTNLATLKNWPAGLVVIDVAWGTVLTAVAASAGHAAASRMN